MLILPGVPPSGTKIPTKWNKKFQLVELTGTNLSINRRKNYLIQTLTPQRIPDNGTSVSEDQSVPMRGSVESAAYHHTYRSLHA